MSSDDASGISANLILNILDLLISKAKDPNNSNFNICDIIGSLTGGDTATNGGIMDAISKYGGQFGLDQNADGKVDMSDAISAVSKKSGGFGGLLGKLFDSK